ncbi:heterokaryon incompatibility protein-domain-containing protein [Cladorrhinum samala]|uniref:Heterokaryon incompatibility protein-domain-containing protein n=1 Tax=Cladorrhinum samala TaxID=585594 RepID=A0AAV9HNG8_9PEZI|nr:heterokaryon incompatibility protein-domain-containing protein [Cladorrhinum samala]
MSFFILDLDQPTPCEVCRPLRAVDCAEDVDGQGADGHSERDAESDDSEQDDVESDDSEQEDDAFRSTGILEDSFPRLAKLNAAAGKGCLYCAFLVALLRSDDVSAALDDVFDDFKNDKVAGFRMVARYDCGSGPGSLPSYSLLKVHGVSFHVTIAHPRRPRENLSFEIEYHITPTSSPSNNDNTLESRSGSEARKSSDQQTSSSHVDEAVEWARVFLSECDNHLNGHDVECTGIRDSSFLPNRLVDISDSPNLLRIVTSEDRGHQPARGDGPPKYTALSYCWGKPSEMSQLYMTTPGNIESRRKHGFPLSELPSVLQDAIHVTKKLSITYIWIDALCILQGSHSDWVCESAHLADIYASAYVTICSLTPSSTISFLKPPRTPRVQVRMESRVNPTLSGIYTLEYSRSEIRNLTNDVGWVTWHIFEPDNRWHSRGWTFVERFSSRRMILFKMPFVGAVCPLQQRSFGEERKRESVDLYRNLHRDLWPAFYGSGHTSTDFYRRWYWLTGFYSDRMFTFPGDVLPALSSVAKVFSKLLSDRYVAGLWESDLHAGLLWESSHGIKSAASLDELLTRLNDRGACAAPSWSWNGHSFGMTWDTPMHPLSALTVSVSSEGADPYGRVSDGELVIVGKSHDVGTGLKLSKPDRIYPSGSMIKLGDSCRIRFSFDWVVDPKHVDEGHNLKLILIALIPNFKWAYGLVLHKAQQDGFHVRVVSFAIEDCAGDGSVPEPFHMAPVETIIVI